MGFKKVAGRRGTGTIIMRDDLTKRGEGGKPAPWPMTTTCNTMIYYPRPLRISNGLHAVYITLEKPDAWINLPIPKTRFELIALAFVV